MHPVSRFLVSHAFFAAACAVSLCVQTAFLFGASSNPQLLFFVFLSTVLGYNFHYCMGEGYRLNWRLSFREWLRFSHVRVLLVFTPSVLFALLFFDLPLVAVFFSVLLTTAYSFPLTRSAIAARLRRFGWVKTVLLAFAWTWVTVVLPLAGQSATYCSPVFAALFAQRFLFMLLLCVIFDLRDTETDALAGLNSLTTRYPDTIILKFVFATAGLLFLANGLLGYYTDYAQAIGLQMTLLLTLYVYRLSAEQKSYYFYYVLVDGLMIFTTLMSIMAGYLVTLP